jgi:hypothetical protein
MLTTETVSLAPESVSVAEVVASIFLLAQDCSREKMLISIPIETNHSRDPAS